MLVALTIYLLLIAVHVSSRIVLEFRFGPPPLDKRLAFYFWGIEWPHRHRVWD